MCPCYLNDFGALFTSVETAFSAADACASEVVPVVTRGLGSLFVYFLAVFCTLYRSEAHHSVI